MVYPPGRRAARAEVVLHLVRLRGDDETEEPRLQGWLSNALSPWYKPNRIGGWTGGGAGSTPAASTITLRRKLRIAG